MDKKTKFKITLVLGVFVVIRMRSQAVCIYFRKVEIADYFAIDAESASEDSSNIGINAPHSATSGSSSNSGTPQPGF